ncbi:MAG: hypothetical protein V3V08_15450 [Nannocystaceae bacterium]
MLIRELKTTTALILSLCALACGPGDMRTETPALHEPARSAPVSPENWIAGNDPAIRASSIRSWTVTGAIASPVDARESPTIDAWSQALFDDAGTYPIKPPVQTVALQCYARQQGEFFTRFVGLPSAPLRRFMAARCGVVGDAPTVQHRIVPGNLDLESARAARSELVRALGQTPDGWFVGYHRSSTAHALLHTVVYARPTIGVDSIVATSDPYNRRVTITGTLPPGQKKLDAITAYGRLSWKHCRYRQPRSRRSFEIRCHVDPSAPYTIVEAGYAHKRAGSLQARSTFFLFIGSNPDNRTYTVPRVVGERVPKPISRGGLLHAINLARVESGSRRVTEEPIYSLAAQSLWDPEGTPFADEGLAALQYYSLAPGHRTPSAIAVASSASSTSSGDLVDELLTAPRFRAFLLGPSYHLALTTRVMPGETSTQTVLLAY